MNMFPYKCSRSESILTHVHNVYAFFVTNPDEDALSVCTRVISHNKSSKNAKEKSKIKCVD